MLSNLQIFAALVALLVWAISVLPCFALLFSRPPERSDGFASYAHSFCNDLSSNLGLTRLLALWPGGLWLLVIITNWSSGLAPWYTQAAFAVLLLLALIYGICMDVIVLLGESYFFQSGLPKGFVFLLADAAIWLAPTSFLIATILGSDHRLAIVLSLPLAIAGSFYLRMLFAVANFKLF